MRSHLLSGPLGYLLALTVVFYGLYGPFEVALPLYIRGDFHAGPELFGFAWAAFGVGALIGGLAGGALLNLRHRAALVRFSVAVVAGWGLAVVVIALVPVAAVLLVAIAVGGAVYAPYPSVVTTLQQRLVDPAMLPSVARLRRGVRRRHVRRNRYRRPGRRSCGSTSDALCIRRRDRASRSVRRGLAVPKGKRSVCHLGQPVKRPVRGMVGIATRPPTYNGARP